MPENSVIKGKAPAIITKVWERIGEFYNPSLQTLGGPWDRTYGFVMVCTVIHLPCCDSYSNYQTRYFAILGAQITGIIRGSGALEPLPKPLIGSEHFGDATAVVL